MIRVPDASDAVRLGLRLAHEIGGRHAFPGVRVGLHTGPAVQREHDWFGTSVNTAARVSGAAVAGEVLVTEATRAAAAGALAEVGFLPRGPTKFKNLSEPIEIYSVTAGGETAPTRLAVDPVCQMAVDPDQAAARRSHGGREYLFCSEACAARFDQAPAGLERRQRRGGELRASDKARERAAGLLRRAYARGRLDTEELEERAAHVQAARTREELKLVLRDLPEYRRWRARARIRRFWRRLIPWPRRRRAS